MSTADAADHRDDRLDRRVHDFPQQPASPLQRARKLELK